MGSLLVSAAFIIGLVLVSAVGNNSWVKTPGIPPGPPYPPLPPTGGLPEKILTLKGRLVYDNGTYKLQVSALPGYTVPLRFATADVQASAAAQVGQEITVSGQWDKSNPTVFVVQSTIQS
jgi:hypothetical protein